ncbi:c-type cytochrome [Paracoccus xiamenensis]|uniref:c-type cytochrome n=1 Tax=Paracoccus xiamenensis TaxID=2714901 RepID=UPI00140BBB0E|nr:cytochrome c [Paracoccus xiamenensis]NHF72393.1 cytochrome c [Paracoccus xiamenensis]
MKRIYLAVFAAMTALSGAASAQDFVQSGSDAKLPGTEGKAIYNAICSGCHMAAGEGATGAGHYPALAGNANLEVPDYPIYLIINGQKAMPPVGDVMDDAQIAAVVNYIRHDLGNNFEGETTAEDVAAAR